MMRRFFPSTIRGGELVLGFPTIEEVGNLLPVGQTTGAQCIGSNDYVYGAQTQATQAQKYNTDTDTYSLIGTIISGNAFKYNALTRIGNKGFSAPRFAPSIQVIDFTDDLTTLFGSFGTAAKWIGSCRAANGFIYAAPGTSANILKINPNDNTTTLLGSFGTATNKWAGACLAENGKIYFPPTSNASILVLDPSTDTTYTTGSFGTATNKWGGITNGLNGKLYCTPLSSTSILEIDPTDDSTRLISAFSGYNTAGQLAPSGHIYFAANSATSFMRYHPITDIVEQFGSFTAPGLNGLSYAPNGNIYGLTNIGPQVLRLSGNLGTSTAAMFEEPASPADLPASLYNKFQNRN